MTRPSMAAALQGLKREKNSKSKDLNTNLLQVVYQYTKLDNFDLSN